MYLRMAEALKAANADPDIRVVAFLGTEGCFSAGNDMADFLAFAMSGAKGKLAVLDLLKALATFEKPLVSGVDGLAIGIGTTLNLHCDLTVASNRSLFKTPFVDLALVPEAASSLLAPKLIGHQRAFALLAMGEGFTAEQALATRLAAKPQQALKIARDLVRGNPADVLARIDEEARHFTAQLQSAEARAAFEAFMRR
jgi:enoyl-CoA hydratase/carnithine racemase